MNLSSWCHRWPLRIIKQMVSRVFLFHHMQINFFHDDIKELIRSLEPATQDKVLRAIDRLEGCGNLIQLPHSRSVSGGLIELRVRGMQEVRIFYVFHRQTAMLLSAFVKKSQQIPTKELEKALRRKRTLEQT